MPRSGRGGKRAGAPGAAYANRSDLNTNRTLPVQAPTGLPYGEAGQLKQAQQAVPMAPSPQTPGPGAVAGGPGAGGPPPPQPGAAGPFNRPTETQLPPTAGLPFGPGPTSVSLPNQGPSPLLKGLALLNSMGEQVPDQVKHIRAVAQASIANQAAL